MASETYALARFIADLDRITVRETSGEAIASQAALLLGRLVKNPDAVPPEFRRRGADGRRGPYILHRAPRFNVTSAVRRPGDTAGAHNHQTWGVIGIIENEIEETRYRVSEAGAGRAKVEATRVMRHGPNRQASGQPEVRELLRILSGATRRIGASF